MKPFEQEDRMYMEHILDLYKRPHNFGTATSASFTHRETNPLCGDDIEMSVRLENGNISEVKFKGIGCAICIASASLITDHATAKSAHEIEELKNDDVYAMLGIHLSPSRVKCALLPLFTLRNGLYFHLHENGRIPTENEKALYPSASHSNASPRTTNPSSAFQHSHIPHHVSSSDNAHVTSQDNSKDSSQDIAQGGKTHEPTGHTRFTC